MSIASKRRQGVKVETHSDLLIWREFAGLEEVVIAEVRNKRNQEQQAASKKRGPTLAIQQTVPRG